MTAPYAFLQLLSALGLLVLAWLVIPVLAGEP